MASIKCYPRVWAGGASGNVWKVSWREGAKQRSKTVYTFKHAKEVRAQIEAAIAEGRKFDPIKGRVRYEGDCPHFSRRAWLPDDITRDRTSAQADEGGHRCPPSVGLPVVVPRGSTLARHIRPVRA